VPRECRALMLRHDPGEHKGRSPDKGTPARGGCTGILQHGYSATANSISLLAPSLVVAA
jgi:hypothetical protein